LAGKLITVNQACKCSSTLVIELNQRDMTWQGNGESYKEEGLQVSCNSDERMCEALDLLLG